MPLTDARNISFNLSGRISPYVVEVLWGVGREASSLGILFFPT